MRRCIAVLLTLLFLGSTYACADMVKLPDKLETIEEEAFSGTESFVEVIVPEGTTTIGPRAFADSSLIQVTLPASIEFIAEDAFINCENVTFEVENEYSYLWARNHGFSAEFKQRPSTKVLKVAFTQAETNPEGQTLSKISEDLYAATEGRYSLGKQ